MMIHTITVWCVSGKNTHFPIFPFFPDLHDELSRSWSNPYSSCVFVHTASIYLTIMGAGAHGYLVMPQVEETLAGYLSPGSSLSLKKSTLSTKRCRLTYLQDGAALHTTAVLQAYQVDLLKTWAQAGVLVRRCFQSYAKPQICLFAQPSKWPSLSVILWLPQRDLCGSTLRAARIGTKCSYLMPPCRLPAYSVTP